MIFGKSLSDYVSFEKGFLILVVVVGLARLALSLLGVPNSTAKFVSLTVLLLLGMVYYSVRVHTSGFGSYKHLLPVLALPVIVANCIIVGGIILAMLTGKDNIYSAPEFSGGVDGKTWGHVGGHVLVTVVGPFIFWLVGSLVMFVTKKVTGSRAQTVGTGT